MVKKLYKVTESPAGPGGPDGAGGGVLVPRSDETRVLIMPADGLTAAPGTPVHLCPSTLGKDEAGLKARFNAIGPGTLDLGRDGSLLMTVQDVLAHPGEVENEETGEIDQVSWLILIDPKGERFATTSQTVARKLLNLLAMRNDGLLSWPINVQILTRVGKRSGRRYHDLMVL